MGTPFHRFFRRATGFFVIVLVFSFIICTGDGGFLGASNAEAQSEQRALGISVANQRIREAIEIQNSHTESLMSIPGVLGTGTGIGANGQPVIRVFTRRAGISGIPQNLDGIPVVVKVTGVFIAYSDPTARFDRPVPIGVSTGHPDITAGTIAARVKDEAGNVYALSNNHVYANQNDAYIGDSALQPGTYDGGSDPADKIGDLYDFEPIDFSVFGSNTMDAAIASTTTSELGNTTLPEGYGTPNSAIFGDSNEDGFFDNMNDLLQLPVQKFGRTTGLTHGEVSEINVTVAVCYADCSNPFFSKYAWFDDQIGITSINTDAFSAGGDSGSLIVTDDPNKKPVGLLFAGSNTRTLANRIDLVLERFGVSIDDAEIELAAPSNLNTSAVSPSQIDLSWDDNSDNEDGFKIERCTGSGCTDFVQIDHVGVDTTIYADTDLAPSTTYRYCVVAFNSTGTSEYSNVAEATTTDSTVSLPAAPSDLTATVQTTGRGKNKVLGSITLIWSDNSDNEDSFVIERCMIGKGKNRNCNFEVLDTVGADQTSYNDTDLEEGKTYRYRVKASNSVGDSDYSNEAQAKT